MTNLAAPRRSNRRLTARMVCQLTVRYRLKKDWHPATAMDLSPNGCRLRLGEDLPRDTHLTVQFEHAGRNGSPPVIAEVVGSTIWSRLEGLSFQVGIQFGTGPSDLDRVILALS